jgi:hypothetical protein
MLVKLTPSDSLLNGDSIVQAFEIFFQKPNTVKRGSIDQGYNEFTAITNTICRISWSQIVGLLHKASQL